jgi:nitrite reductase (cytochrome c-552)
MSENNQNNNGKKRGIIMFAATMIIVFILGMLLMSIIERRDEAAIQTVLDPIEKEWETDSSVWGKNYPRQYNTYKMQEDDTTRTKFGGSYPRNYLESTPANVILFAGYGFSKEYLQARGHVFAVKDVTETARTGEKTPATCWTCKSPDVPRMMDEMGVAEFYDAQFVNLKDEITHPIGCADCHDPKTMKLTITRPALREAFEAQNKKLEDISHQEMRSLVCAQCHVEYYFEGEGDYLTFPWEKGMGVENMEDYYNSYNFTDWVHPISGTNMIKMQHPDYEIYKTGVHAYRNVSCADCHMPYRTEGGVKFTNHHVQSPLLDVENSCGVCHGWSEEEIISRVEGIQTKVANARDDAERALSYAHFDVAACMQAGATDEEVQKARDLIRAAQLRWDYVAANNGMGFHSPQECMRILGDAVDLAQESRIASARLLAKYGYNEVIYPEFDSEEKAKAVIKPFVEGNPTNLLGEPMKGIAE